MAHSLSALAAVLAFSLSSSVFAGTTIETQGFTIDDRWGVSLKLLSDSNNVAKFDLTNIATIDYSVTERYEWNGGDMKFDFFSVSARDGYRVTSIEYSGVISGELIPAPDYPDKWPNSYWGGTATNSSQATFSAYDPDAHPANYVQKVLTFNNLNETVPFSLQNSTLLLPQAFQIDLNVSAWLGLTPGGGDWFPGQGDEGYYSWTTPSTTKLRVLNPVLTLTYAPLSAVPEPSTYAMLLAGLALCGIVRRRRAG